MHGPLSRYLRRSAALVATLAWAALALQLYLSIRLSLANGGGAAHGVWMYCAYFTILTNALAALSLTIPLLAPESTVGRFFAAPGTLAGVATNIVMVGIVYNLLLRHVWNPQGLQRLADLLLHDAVPVAVLVHALILGAETGATLADRMRWAGWPIGYLLYALARGALTGFYSYPFIDVAQLGYARVLVNATGLTVGFAGLAVILFGLQRLRAGFTAR